MKPSRDGEYYCLTISGLVIKSLDENLLFDTLMFAIIDKSIPKDPYAPSVVYGVKPEKEEDDNVYPSDESRARFIRTADCEEEGDVYIF